MLLLAGLYLGVPAAIMFLALMPWTLAAPLGLGLVAWAWVARRSAPPLLDWPSPRSAIALLVVSAAVIWVSGVLPPFAEAWDWPKHYGIFNLLAGQDWPPTIDIDGSAYVLRYTAAFYVVPALAAKLIGLAALPYLIFVWMTLGLFIGLGILLQGAGLSVKNVILAALVIVAFSGLDVVGFWLSHNQFGPPTHLEWWTLFQPIPSVLTGILWTPQHTLPAMIVAGVILRYPELAVRHACAIVATVAVWSAFSVIGIIPLLLWALFSVRVRPAFSLSNFIAGPLLVVPVAIYLTNDTSGIPFQPIWQQGNFFWSYYVISLGLEIWLPAIVVSIAAPKYRWLIVTGSIMVTVISLVHGGAAGDLLMRASAPSLIVWAAIGGMALSSVSAVRAAPLIVFLFLGSFTPMGEMMRAAMSPRMNPADHDLVVYSKADPLLRVQYFAAK